MAPTPPPSSVLEAFSLSNTPSFLPGGQGQSFRVGIAVVKFIANNEAEEAEWSSRILTSLPSSPRFTTPTPILASNGQYVCNGWTATKFCDGTDRPVGHWEELFTAATAFHKALEGVPEPEFLSRRTHPWAKADRVAWGEESVTVVPYLALLHEKLVALRKDVIVQPQLVHGDLSGNVLFGSETPVIIDFSPFWRCVEYSVAIAVADGIADFEEGEELLSVARFEGEWVQMLIRALIFRIVARSELVEQMGKVSDREINGFERVMGVIAKYV